MSYYENSKYKIFEIEGIHPLVFGEAYVVLVGIQTMQQYFIGEYHVITKRPEPSLLTERIRYEKQKETGGMITVDLDFMINECKLYVDRFIYDYIEKIAAKINRDPLLSGEVLLTERDSLVSCWLRNVFNEKIVELARATESKSLYEYLDKVRQLRTFSPY